MSGRSSRNSTTTGCSRPARSLSRPFPRLRRLLLATPRRARSSLDQTRRSINWFSSSVRHQSGSAFDPDRHPVFLATRATHYCATVGRLARCGGPDSPARPNQSSASCLGGPDPYSTSARGGVSCVAESASFRSFEIDDSRRRMEPHRQPELGYSKSSLEF